MVLDQLPYPPRLKETARSGGADDRFPPAPSGFQRVQIREQKANRSAVAGNGEFSNRRFAKSWVKKDADGASSLIDGLETADAAAFIQGDLHEADTCFLTSREDDGILQKSCLFLDVLTFRRQIPLPFGTCRHGREGVEFFVDDGSQDVQSGMELVCEIRHAQAHSREECGEGGEGDGGHFSAFIDTTDVIGQSF